MPSLLYSKYRCDHFNPYQRNTAMAFVASYNWNKLPCHLSSISTLPAFRKWLEHHLVSNAYLVITSPSSNITLCDVSPSTNLTWVRYIVAPSRLVHLVKVPSRSVTDSCVNVVLLTFKCIEFSSLISCYLSAYKLLQVDIYRQRLKERERRKTIAKEYGILQDATSAGSKKIKDTRKKLLKDEKWVNLLNHSLLLFSFLFLISPVLLFFVHFKVTLIIWIFILFIWGIY